MNHFCQHFCDCVSPVKDSSQPPTVVCKVEEAQLEYVHIAYTFLHVWRQFACLVGVY